MHSINVKVTSWVIRIPNKTTWFVLACEAPTANIEEDMKHAVLMHVVLAWAKKMMVLEDFNFTDIN